jgi:transcriptional/translational regulatory protein YebC/TACO1
MLLARGLAGHNRWVKIKRAKAGNDKQRAVMFTKWVDAYK